MNFTTAQKIATKHHDDISAMMDEAEEKAIEVIQDWEVGETDYSFEDGSLLKVNGQNYICG